MTALPVGGPELPQRRNLVTEIPGPISRTLMERRNSTVARGVSTTLPVFITAAGGGVMLDADGNSLIDFGSGIAVASVGNAADAVVSRVQQQVAQFTHTCFMVTPYEGYVEVCEELARRTPGDPREALRAVQLGRRGGRERGEDRPPLHRAAGGGRVRPRLPRPHQPDDGADRQEHALQARLRPVRARGLPGADGLPAALADRPGGVQGRGARDDQDPDPQAGRRGQRRRRHHRADPGRGRLHRAAGGVPRRAWPSSARRTASSSSPTRSSPASAAPATGSPASTRASSPT